MLILSQSVNKHGRHRQILFVVGPFLKKSSPTKTLGQMNWNLIGSTYGRFCIKFPQSRMKGERHRLSPLAPSLFFIQFQICSFCKMFIIMGYKQAIYYFSLEFVKCNFYVQNLDLNELFRVIKDDYLFYFGKVSQIILRLYMYHAA